MVYEKDWFMRQIRSLVLIALRLVFGKDLPDYFVGENGEQSDADLLHLYLKSLLDNKKINEAENYMFDKLDTGDLRYLELALDFYSRLNELDDNTLEAADYSRDEIKTGIADVLKLFGYEDVAALTQDAPED